MSNYRRIYQKSACYFFTVVTYKRQMILQNENAITRLRDAFHRVIQSHLFQIDAIVVLPDHVHSIWRLPTDDADYSTRWMLIKRYFSMGCNAHLNQRRERTVWQRRFWEHTIRDDRDWRRHMDYIHYNPVKHGYVFRPIDWRYGSFRQAVQKGYYANDWGAQEPETIRYMDYE